MEDFLEEFHLHMDSDMDVDEAFYFYLEETAPLSPMIPSAELQPYPPSRPSMHVEMTLNSLNQETGAYPVGPHDLTNRSTLGGPVLADRFHPSLLLESASMDCGTTQVNRAEDTFLELLSDFEKADEQLPFFQDLNDNVPLLEIPDDGSQLEIPEIDISDMSFNLLSSLSYSEDNSSPFKDYFLTSNESSESYEDLVTAAQMAESTLGIVADHPPALPDSSLPNVISNVPKVPVGRKKIDMDAKKYVTTEDSDDSSETDSSSSDWEDSDSSSCDSIDVETVEGETSSIQLLRDFGDGLTRATKIPKLPQPKNEVDSRSGKRHSGNNKENNVSSARASVPVKAQTTFATAQQPNVSSKQLSNNLDEPSEIVRRQSTQSAKKLSNSSAASLKTTQPATVPARKLSNSNSSNPLKTARQPTASARQSTASASKPKTTNPIILLEPPQIDPDSKKGRRSRNYKSTEKNESSTKKIAPQRTKQKVSDETKPSVIKSSPPSSISVISSQSNSSTSSSQTPPQSTPKPSSCSSSQTPSQSTTKPSIRSSSQNTLVPPPRKIQLVDMLPEFLSVPDKKTHRTPAYKLKSQGAVRRAKINTVTGDKQTILFLDNVTVSEPVKTAASLKSSGLTNHVAPSKTVASVQTGTVKGGLVNSVAHDHNYSNNYSQKPQKTKTIVALTSTQFSANQLVKSTKTAADISQSCTPLRTNKIVSATSRQLLRNQVDNLTKTTDIPLSHTPQRTKKNVAPTSTQPLENQLVNSIETASTIPVYTMDEFNAKYHTNYKIGESLVNGVSKKKLSVGEYRSRHKNVQKISVGTKPQAPPVQKRSTQASRSHQEMFSGILAAKQQDLNTAECHVRRPDLPVVQPVQLAKKEDEVRVRTIRPPPDIITVHTVERGTNTEVKLDDQLIASLDQTNMDKLVGNSNSLFSALLSLQFERTTTPTQEAATSPEDDFKCPTIRHRTKDEVAHIETRSIEVQTDLHFGSSEFSGYASRNSVRSPSPTSSHHSLHSYHDASNGSLGDSRSSRSRSYTASPEVMGGWSPHSNSSSHSNSRFLTFSSSYGKRKYDEIEHTQSSRQAPLCDGSGVKRKLEDEEHNNAVEERRVLFVGGLEHDETPSDLGELFGRFGTITRIKICPRKTRPDKFAFLTFQSHHSCVAAFEQCKNDINFKYEVGFGGRRRFCDAPYVDFDNGSIESTSNQRRVFSTFLEELADYNNMKMKKRKKT